VFILITITGMALTAGESVLHYAQAISLGVLPIVLKLVAKNLSDNEEER
jgi:hypothetical protein